MLKWIPGEWHLISRTGSFNNQVMSPLNVHVRGLRQRPSDQPSRAICDPSTPSRLGRGRPPPAAPLTSPPRATRSFAVIWLSSERSGRLYAYHSAALACAWRACGRISQSSRHLMLVPKPRNRKWRLILRTCCPPPAAALRAAYARCARVFSLFFCLFHSVILPKKCRFGGVGPNRVLVGSLSDAGQQSRTGSAPPCFAAAYWGDWRV